MKRFFCAVLALFLLLSFIGCSSEKNDALYSYAADMAPAETEEHFAEEPAFSLSDGAIAKTGATVIQTDRKMIYRCSYEMQSKHFDKALSDLKDLCDRCGAWYASASVNAYGNMPRNAFYTIRVPVVQLEELTSGLSSVATVISENQNNDDVTELYIDNEARLESAKVREERVLEILKNADKLDDVLTLEKELADIRYEIETLTGTLRHYDSLVEYATVSVSVSEVTTEVPPGNNPLTFGERMGKGFKAGLNGFVSFFANVAVFLSYSWIFLILAALIVFVIVKVIQRKNKNKPSVK